MAPKKPVDRVGLEAARNVLNAVLLADSFTQVGIYVSVIMRPITGSIDVHFFHATSEVQTDHCGAAQMPASPCQRSDD